MPTTAPFFDQVTFVSISLAFTLDLIFSDFFLRHVLSILRPKELFVRLSVLFLFIVAAVRLSDFFESLISQSEPFDLLLLF